MGRRRLYGPERGTFSRSDVRPNRWAVFSAQITPVGPCRGYREKKAAALFKNWRCERNSAPSVARPHRSRPPRKPLGGVNLEVVLRGPQDNLTF